MVDIKICVPYYNVIEEETQQGIYDLLDSEEINCALLTVQGTNIANARNKLVNEDKSDLMIQKLDDGFTHYLFIDADVVVTPKAIKRLLDLDLDVVSAVYKSREQSDTFTAGIFAKNENGEFIDALKFKSDSTGLMEADWVGGGCLLVKKEVLENTPYPWFHYPVKEITKNGNIHRKLIFEDIGFCMNVKDAGYRIYVDCDTEVKHLARNYNSPIVNDYELVFKNINDDMNKMFQIVRGLSYELDRVYKESNKEGK